jgi:hypothetical protein
MTGKEAFDRVLLAACEYQEHTMLGNAEWRRLLLAIEIVRADRDYLYPEHRR